MSTITSTKRYCANQKLVVSVAICGWLLLFGSNQSANAATLLFSDNFESGGLSAWDDYHGVKIVTSPVHSGTSGLAYCYGCSGFNATGGGNTLKKLSPIKHLYLSFYWYFPSGYNFAWRAGGHAFRIIANHGGSLDTEIGSDLNMPVFGNCAAGNCTNYSLYNGVQTNFSANHWYHVEVDIQMNGNGLSDGYFKVYVDSQQILNSVGQHFSDADEYWNELWITSNDDSCVGGASACTYYIDDVQVWDSNPGTIGGPVALPPPANLRVQ